MGADEALRLRALAQREILDTPPEPEFDELTALAAGICGTPMAVITLIDEKRQWFKSQFGLALSETPRDIAFCNTTIQHAGLTIVEDASHDSRFADNPFVHANLGIRFYGFFRRHRSHSGFGRNRHARRLYPAPATSQ